MLKRDRTRLASFSTRTDPSFAAFLFLSVLLGCVDPSVDPSKVSANLVSAGEYEIREGLPVPTEFRTKIPCEVGRLFGVDYTLEAEGGETGALPVEFRWTHPSIQTEESALPTAVTKAGASNPVMERGRARLPGRSLWSIDQSKEQVPGLYRFEIRLIGDGRVLLSQDFEIDGC